MSLALTASTTRSTSETRRLVLFLALHIVVWTGFCLLYLAPSDLQNDMTEAFSWGQEMQWGYYKHPPFYAWVVRAWFSVWPTTDWAFYLLSSINSAIGLAAVWAIAGRYLAGPARLAAVLLLEFLPFYTFQSFNFNANSVLLSLWPLTVLLFLRSYDRRDVASAVALGTVAAAAMLSKYYSGIILACCLVAALAHPDRRRYFASATPYVALAVMAVLLTPHVLWHMNVAIGPMQYMASKSHSGVLRIFSKAGLFIVGCIAVHMVAAAILAWLWRRGRATPGDRPVAPSTGDNRMLAVFALGPFVLTVLIALVFQVKIVIQFAIPIFALSPLAAIVWLRIAVDDRSLRRLAGVTAAFVVLLLAAAPFAGLKTLQGNIELAAEPRRAVAEELTQLWHDRIGTPLGVVAGTESYALGTTYYSPDHPSDFTGFATGYAPWIDTDRLRRDGLAVICLSRDAWCMREAGKYDHLDTVRSSFSVGKTLFGVAGRTYDFTAILVRPGQTLPMNVIRMRPF